jgi:hypothetical protein
VSADVTGDEAAPGPLELLESARTKHRLATARLRRGPPELALLSIHGAVEDVLRAHGLRLELPEADAPFVQLLDVLTRVRERPLSSAEAEGVRRMHRLRARVAHGEHIVVARETIEAYMRLATRLLPRYGVFVTGPEDAEAAPAQGGGRREGDTLATLRLEPAASGRTGTTARLEREAAGPRRERTVYPETGARYPGQARPSKATADLPLAREWGAAGHDGPRGRRGVRRDDLWDRARAWLLPGLAILTIFLVGAVMTIALQQLRAEPPVPTAALPTTAGGPATLAPQVTSVAAAAPPSGAATAVGATAAPAAAPIAAPTGALAPGRTAYVRAESGGLNVRARAGTAPDNPVLFSLAPGTAVEVVAGPVDADGFTWWQVRGPTAEGWCAGQYLEVR